VNWLIKGDVDFKDYPLFSKKFHVVTKDKDRLNYLLYNKPLDELTEFPDMELEINGNQCFFRCSKQPMDQEITKEFVALGKLLLRVFN
jgi:hypothetical protein